MSDLVFVLFCKDKTHLLKMKSHLEENGYEFTLEKHGSGPEHWIADLNYVGKLELYIETKPRNGDMFGLVIDGKFIPIRNEAFEEVIHISAVADGLVDWAVYYENIRLKNVASS